MPRVKQDYDDDDYEEEDFSSYDDDDDDDGEGLRDTYPCPNCGKLLYDDAEQCPSCSAYISEEDQPRPKLPLWIIIGLILCFIAVFTWFC